MVSFIAGRILLMVCFHWVFTFGKRFDFWGLGSIKKGNRHSEILLRDVEVRLVLGSIERVLMMLVCYQHVATFASLYKLYKKDYVYPKQTIDDSWEKVLLNQCELSCLFVEIVGFLLTLGLCSPRWCASSLSYLNLCY